MTECPTCSDHVILSGWNPLKNLMRRVQHPYLFQKRLHQVVAEPVSLHNIQSDTSPRGSLVCRLHACFSFSQSFCSIQHYSYSCLCCVGINKVAHEMQLNSYNTERPPCWMPTSSFILVVRNAEGYIGSRVTVSQCSRGMGNPVHLNTPHTHCFAIWCPTLCFLRQNLLLFISTMIPGLLVATRCATK